MWPDENWVTTEAHSVAQLNQKCSELEKNSLNSWIELSRVTRVVRMFRSPDPTQLNQLSCVELSQAFWAGLKIYWDVYIDEIIGEFNLVYKQYKQMMFIVLQKNFFCKQRDTSHCVKSYVHSAISTLQA